MNEMNDMEFEINLKLIAHIYIKLCIKGVWPIKQAKKQQPASLPPALQPSF